MNCERARLEIPLLGSGELEPRLEAEVWRHLERCAPCRAFEGEERALDDLLAQWRTEGPGRDIASVVLAAAFDAGAAESAARGAPLRRLFRTIWPIGAAAAAALVAVALVPFDRPEELGGGGTLGPTVATAADFEDSIPIGSGLIDLALPPRNPFRP